MKEQVIELIINCLPALIAVITCIATSFKLIAALKEWKESNDTSSIAQLEKDLKNVVKENLELKKNMQEVLNTDEATKQQLRDALILLTVKAEEKKEE